MIKIKYQDFIIIRKILEDLYLENGNIEEVILLSQFLDKVIVSMQTNSNNNMSDNGIVSIDWNALNGDAEGKDYSLSEMLDYVKQTSEGKNQIVILMHDTYGKEKTVQVLPDIIDYYKNNGFEFKVIKS